MEEIGRTGVPAPLTPVGWILSHMVDTAKLFDIALHVIALVIGIAVVVLLAIEMLDIEAAVSLLAVGLASLALATIETGME